METGSHQQSRRQLQKASERATFTQSLEDVLPDWMSETGPTLAAETVHLR